MEIIYIDSLFFLNLLTDYLLCLFSARLSGVCLKRWRYFAAALLGAAYSVSVFLPGMGFMAAPAVKLGAALIMGLVAFGAEERPLRCTGVFLAVSATFGGALYALGLSYENLNLGVLLISFVGCYLLLSLISHFKARAPEKSRAQVELRFLGKSSRFIALIDTGNCLTDPGTGAKVMVVCPAALKSVFGGSSALLEISDPVALLEAAAGYPELRGKLRLIPYSAMGGSGLLPLFRPESLTIDGRERRELLVAVSPNASGGGFQAIL